MGTQMAGIEALNCYAGSAWLDVRELAEARGLDMRRFDNLMMVEKTVPMPFEDPVSLAVNAAKPIVDELSEQEKQRIEMLITCTESGIDFGKSLSTYVHDYLGLSRGCRLFEVKQACYCATAGFQMALNFVLSQVSPGAKALVVATDLVRYMLVEGSDALGMEWSYAEPSSGAGAMAILVSSEARIMPVDVGCNGYYGYEVMDTCRPEPDSEAGDADTSLLAYLECCEHAYREYERRVEGVDYQESFGFLAFHTPFGGMIKGAHRTMMRKFKKAAAEQVEEDFAQRVMPGLVYCQRVGNIMGGTVFLSLASTIDNGDFEEARRVGLFSYGSGCCSEFYSGVITPEARSLQAQRKISEGLDARTRISMEEYEQLLHSSTKVAFGTRNMQLNGQLFPKVWEGLQGRNNLVLTGIEEFHRHYEWV